MELHEFGRMQEYRTTLQINLEWMKQWCNDAKWYEMVSIEHRNWNHTKWSSKS